MFVLIGILQDLGAKSGPVFRPSVNSPQPYTTSKINKVMQKAWTMAGCRVHGAFSCTKVRKAITTIMRKQHPGMARDVAAQLGHHMTTSDSHYYLYYKVNKSAATVWAINETMTKDTINKPTPDSTEMTDPTDSSTEASDKDSTDLPDTPVPKIRQKRIARRLEMTSDEDENEPVTDKHKPVTDKPKTKTRRLEIRLTRLEDMNSETRLSQPGTSSLQSMLDDCDDEDESPDVRQMRESITLPRYWFTFQAELREMFTEIDYETARQTARLRTGLYDQDNLDDSLLVQGIEAAVRRQYQRQLAESIARLGHFNVGKGRVKLVVVAEVARRLGMRLPESRLKEQESSIDSLAASLAPSATN